MRKLKIFVADIEKALCKNIEHYCAVSDDVEFSGYANDGEEAFFKISVCRPDVLITDVILPKTDGLALLEKINGELEPRPKVIISSVLENAEIIRKTVELGAVYYMFKPYSLAELHDRILLVAGGFTADQNDRRENIKRCLCELTAGILDKNNSLGFNYLLEAIIIMDRLDCSFPISKNVYAPVAKIFCSSTASVEVLIRKTKSRLLSDSNIRQRLGCCESMKNTEFLTLMKDFISAQI